MLGGRPLTIEVASEGGRHGRRAGPGRRPAHAARGATVPAGFDHDAIPVFNTNTASIDDLSALRRSGRSGLAVRRAATSAVAPAVQLERLYHELSWFVPTTFLEVPRRGPRGRFFPIKTPDDLVR